LSVAETEQFNWPSSQGYEEDLAIAVSILDVYRSTNRRFYNHGVINLRLLQMAVDHGESALK
jgi:hypothetical protein